MKAAVLKQFGSPLEVNDVPDPVPGAGEVIVDVVAAGVLSYMAEVLSGKRQYQMRLPIVPGPGAVGRVRAIGPDATRLQVGEWVHCDPTIRARDGGPTPDITLHGLSARGEGGLRLQDHFHDGAWAEQMRVPTENVFPLGDIDSADAALWCALGRYLVPYGGLLSIGFCPGETLLVSGSTGPFGDATIAVALAMGARCVVAAGRNAERLAKMRARYGARLRTATLTGDEAGDIVTMKAAAPGAIDAVLDVLPPWAPASFARAAAMTVREFGRVSLMGGVGMLGGDDLALPYPWIMRNNITIRGQWMYPPEANTLLIAIVQAGLLDLSKPEVITFPLEQVNEAVAAAAGLNGRAVRAVICPGMA